MLKVLKKCQIYCNKCYCTDFNSFQDTIFNIAPKILANLKSGDPVVALESTIITHGMPYPENYKTALAVEKIVEENGATPATIAVVKGRVCIGLEKQDLEYLASNSSKSIKISRRDLPYVISKNLSGGTTVSATMLLAHRVGIPIFATGGIGGVHRDAEKSMDISCDLTELGRTPITVVSSGVKSILDIPKTLEFLETQGVCVITVGQTREFPAFFTPKSNCHSPYKISSPEEAAELIAAAEKLNLESGILLAVPIPNAFAADGNEIEAAIQLSLKEASASGIFGKDVTPFILKRVNELTEGRSLAANTALIKNNAKIASLISVALSKYRKSLNPTSSSSTTPLSHKKPFLMSPPSIWSHQQTSRTSDEKHTQSPVVIGGSIVDFVLSVTEPEIKMDGSTHPGFINQVYGGVGRNINEALQRFNHTPIFLSAIGNDNLGKFILNRFPREASDVRIVNEVPTATYSAILDHKGECMFGIGDMKMHEMITIDYINKYQDQIKSAPLVVMDGNVPLETMNYILQMCLENKVPVWFEPTDVNKASKPFKTDYWRAISYISPNIDELSMVNQAVSKSPITKLNKSDDLCTILNKCIELAQPLIGHINTVLITLGHNGILIVRNVPYDAYYPLTSNRHFKEMQFQPSAVYYPISQESNKLISVSGSGDCLAAAFISSILENATTHQCAASALEAAAQSTHSIQSVPETLKLNKITRKTIQKNVIF